MNTSRNTYKLGTFLCTLSAIAYTAYNLCLGDASKRQDPAWVNCITSFVSVALVGPYLIWLIARGRKVFTSLKESLSLLGVSLITQLGCVLLVWAMSIVGAAVSIILQTGIMLASSAILGYFFLRERVSILQIAAIILITFSIAFFCIGAETVDSSGISQSLSFRGLMGVGAASLSGIAFAILTVAVRKTVTGDTLPLTVVFLMNVMGVVALGPWSIYTVGVDKLIHTAHLDLGLILAAGVFNLIAFFLVTKSLQMIPVVRLNVLNNGLSSLLTALAGTLLLHEPWNKMLSIGMFLGIISIFMISLRASK